MSLKSLPKLHCYFADWVSLRDVEAEVKKLDKLKLDEVKNNADMVWNGAIETAQDTILNGFGDGKEPKP